MNTDELKNLVLSHAQRASGGDYSAIRSDRERALDAYFGRPLGNEVEGQSQVVSRDVTDTIEWILPSLLRVFTSAETAEFEPVGPEDEDLARQEAQYVEHVFMKQNRGFMTLYSWFKDALLEKDGYVKYWFEKKKTVTTETYTGLTDDDLLYLSTQVAMTADDSEIIEQDQDEKTGLHDVKFRLTQTMDKVCVECTPPEEVLVSTEARENLQEAEFVGHRRRLTRSELIAKGYPRSKVESLPLYTERSQDTNWWRRRQYDFLSTSDSQDDATDKIEYLEGYVLADFDNDGIAERRRVVIAGNEVLENDYYDEVPFAHITAIPLPHQHHGLSIYDLIEDLSQIKTTLWRQLLDNAYLANQQRHALNEEDVNLEDYFSSRIGGAIRVYGNPHEKIMAMPYTNVIHNILPVLDYTDSIKENRAGQGKATQGLDPDVLRDATKGAFEKATTAANQRIEAIARIFAETGVRDLYLAIHRLLNKNQDRATRIRLTNGEWLRVRPDLWKTRTDLTVRAGIGTNSQEEIKANIMLLGDLMQRAAQVPGLVLPENAYNFAEKAAKELGFAQKGVYFTDPASPKAQKFLQSLPKQGNPLVEVEMAKGQYQLTLQAMKNRLKYADIATDLGISIAELEVKYGVDLAKEGVGAELEMMKMMGGMQNANQNAPGGPGQTGGGGQPAQG